MQVSPDGQFGKSQYRSQMPLATKDLSSTEIAELAVCVLLTLGKKTNAEERHTMIWKVALRNSLPPFPVKPQAAKTACRQTYSSVWRRSRRTKFRALQCGHSVSPIPVATRIARHTRLCVDRVIWRKPVCIANNSFLANAD